MSSVRSADGTAIAFDRVGAGPPVILVDGALCYRKIGPGGPLAPLLARHFTVFTYDRRGRGGSGDTQPYAVEREVEDIQALVEAAGGSAALFGHSSGALLALEAAGRTPAVGKLALYEAPLIVDDSRPPTPHDYAARLDALLASDRRGDATRLFVRQVGLPAIAVALMRFTPMWAKLKAIAHTLAYDAAIVGEYQRGEPLPVDRWTNVTMPTLVLTGGRSSAWFDHGARALADVLPRARTRVIEGQRHDVKAKALAPVLVDFFNGDGATRVRDSDPPGAAELPRR